MVFITATAIKKNRRIKTISGNLLTCTSLDPENYSVFFSGTTVADLKTDFFNDDTPFETLQSNTNKVLIFRDSNNNAVHVT